MMIKQIALFCRKPGLDPQSFMAHYEERHAPLVTRAGGRFLADYRRNYVIREPASSARAGNPPSPEFDVATEVWFETRSDLDGLAAAWADPEIGTRIAEDEARFLDRSKMVVYLADERITPVAALPTRPAAAVPPVKVILLLKKKAGMSLEAFQDYYETRHEPLARELIPEIASYRRSYTIPDSSYVYPHIKDVPPPPDFDVMTELWFNSAEDYHAMGARMQRPDIGNRIAADQENLFERGRTLMFLTEERVTPVNLLKAGSPVAGRNGS